MLVCSYEQNSKISPGRMKDIYAVLFFAALAATATCLFEKKYVLVNTLMPWNEAQAYCRQHYVDLVTITNAKDILRINALVHKFDEGWLGLKKEAPESSYTRWSDGTKLTFVQWGLRQWNAPTSCVTLYDSEFYNASCALTVMSFCYKWVPEPIVVQEMMTWEESLQYCRKNHHDLISISTEEDEIAVKRAIGNLTGSLWTGLRFMNAQWFWVNQKKTEKAEDVENLKMFSLPSCPAKPYHCGDISSEVKVKVTDCNEQKYFICY